jgi:hypothetical protein
MDVETDGSADFHSRFLCDRYPDIIGNHFFERFALAATLQPDGAFAMSGPIQKRRSVKPIAGAASRISSGRGAFAGHAKKPPARQENLCRWRK